MKKTEKTLNEFEIQIQQYLENRCKTDELFLNFYSNESKDIHECCRYIVSEVQKQKRVAFADSEIFDLAVHYYMENDLVVTKTPPQVTVKHSSSKVEPQPKAKKDKPVSTPSVAENGWIQPTLF